MVNGNYVLYGDKPCSDSEIVNDHVQTKTAERKTKRKNRHASELPRSLDELDNETDAVKYEKKIKEPRLIRYVPTTDVQEHFVTEKFETYDLKPTEEPPRRYSFTKKPKNPADGSVNYAYSRSSSSCSSPNGNLPTISEHCENYGTYRVRSPTHDNAVNGYDTKLDKYFEKPMEVKTFASKVGYHGSHPDSLYRVGPDGAGGAGKTVRALRLLRWPLALFTVCVALAVFVYFLMPVNMDNGLDTVNATYWEDSISGAQSHSVNKVLSKSKQAGGPDKTRTSGTRTSEIDFYDAETNKNYDLSSIIETITETIPNRKLPIQPIFPTHITPEVQYGNEKADTEKIRSPKLLKDANTLPDDSTLKPHITHKPEKPLAVYFKDGNGVITTTTAATIDEESFTNAESSNDISNYHLKQFNKKQDEQIKFEVEQKRKTPPAPTRPVFENTNVREQFNGEPELPPEVQEFYNRPAANSDVKFTSGHSKLFGISIEDAENMKSTTQNSLYNTRVSPTLPTWRNRDDSTTKKYAINGNFDVPQCRSTRLPLCRGVLPYDLAGAPASVGMVDVSTLLPQIEYLVSTNCSQRVRHFACALLEPECSPPPYSAKLPCYNFCKAIVDHCDGVIPTELQAMFSCNQYSSSNCASARTPCFTRELACGDGSCVPRDWVCDGTRDCPGGEDELPCASCDEDEYRCSSGMCITKRWLCDGYADCTSGEDESVELCRGRGANKGPASGGLRGTGGYNAPLIAGDEDEVEPGEELAGSAPAPSVRKPNRLPNGDRNVDGDSSKELLMTSDSNNAFKRNFTRRPSPSRLTPYKRPSPVNTKTNSEENTEAPRISPIRKTILGTQRKVAKPNTKIENTKPVEEIKQESDEDINVGDLTLFDDIEKEKSDNKEKKEPPKPQYRTMNRFRTTEAPPAGPVPTRLDKTINKFERVIDGASMLKKAARERQEDMDSPETNGTTAERADELTGGYNSAHASPCPSGELRCVDGRCITLAQLCDGTIDCTDHADEDNCYT